MTILNEIKPFMTYLLPFVVFLFFVLIILNRVGHIFCFLFVLLIVYYYFCNLKV